MKAFSDLEEHAFSPNHRAEAESARDNLLRECSLQASREGVDSLPLDSERLDEMARFVAEDAKLRSEVARRRGNEALSGILDELVERLEATDCQRCVETAGGSFPCGDRVDHGLVDRGGECIADLRELFDFSVRLGSTLYSNAWHDDGPVGKVDLHLRTRILPVGSRIHGLARLSAKTEFALEGDRKISLVSLSVDGLNYGAAERHAAAYYFVHEIVAHAFYDVDLVEDRTHRDPHDLWSEGWMDCVAADLLVEVLEGAFVPSCTPPGFLRANRMCVDVVRRCHSERYDPAPGVPGHEINGMRLARKRYVAMRYRLKALDPTSTFNAMRTVQLACAIINANGARNATVAAVNSAAAAFAFGAEANSALTVEERRFYAAMASFVGHRDETRLIGDLA